ncbi:MAG: hypothetical protein FWH34_03405 [Desulfovibrionaceae bacterium]|nr:hypothetical protein [Desulfovibrionaceae bacterium]
MIKIIPAVLVLLVLSLATATGYSDRCTPYIFTGNFQKVKEGPRSIETLVLQDKNSGYRIIFGTVESLRDKIIPKGYISQSLMDCIVSPETPYGGPVEIVAPISRIGNLWFSIQMPEAVCKRL